MLLRITINPKLINKVVLNGIKTALTLRTAKILQIYYLRYVFYQIPVFRYRARTIWFPPLYGFHLSKVCILFISQGKEFQMTGRIL